MQGGSFKKKIMRSDRKNFIGICGIDSEVTFDKLDKEQIKSSLKAADQLKNIELLNFKIYNSIPPTKGQYSPKTTSKKHKKRYY